MSSAGGIQLTYQDHAFALMTATQEADDKVSSDSYRLGTEALETYAYRN